MKIEVAFFDQTLRAKGDAKCFLSALHTENTFITKEWHVNSINNWSANKQRQAKHIKTPYAYREIPKLLGIQSSKVLQATGHYKKHTLHIPWLNPCSQEFFLPDFSTLILTVLPCIAMYCHIASLTICCKRARMSSSANGHDDSSVKQCQANKWRMWHLMAMAAMLPRNLHITIYHNIQIKSCHNMSQPATASGPLRFDHLWISFWSLNPFDQSLICVVHLAPRCAVRQNLRAVSSRPKAQRPQAWPLWNLEILGTWNISEKNQTY